jgi:L-arabinose isomerase
MIKVGLFGIGLDTYWPQFDGLLERLVGYLNEIDAQVTSLGASTLNGGMVDNPFKASEVADRFARERVDVVFLVISTYALSHNVLPLVQTLRVPILVLNLQPAAAVDYVRVNALGDRGKMTGEWLAHCQSCVAPELASVFQRAGIRFQLLTGYLHEPYVRAQLQEHLEALAVWKTMRQNRVGVMGHYYNGMLDVYSDLTQQAATFGNHFELVEFGTLKQLRDQTTEQEVAAKVQDLRSAFSVSPECSATELARAARTAVALDKLVAQHKLGSLAYYYEGVGDADYEDIVTSLIPGLTLLTGEHVPVAGECEIKNVQAMKIMDAMGCGGSFSEFYAMDFLDDVVLLGHDGPAHFRIAEGRVGLVPLPVYHGKPGKGLSIQMKVANGPVTLLSVCQNRQGALFLLTAQGESVEGPTLQLGNTNSRYRFPMRIRDFMDRWSLAGPSHHCAIGMGHKATTLKKLAALLEIECVQVC